MFHFILMTSERETKHTVDVTNETIPDGSQQVDCHRVRFGGDRRGHRGFREFRGFPGFPGFRGFHDDDDPVGCGRHGFGWGHPHQAPDTPEDEEEELTEEGEIPDDEKNIKKLTKDEKKQLKEQLRRYIFSRKHGGPRFVRRQIFRNL
jgi:hypothetical protein